MTLVRYQDWPSRLAKFVEDARCTPFLWGKWDCCLMACSAVEAITGADPVSDLRGKYRTRLGAFRIMKDLSGGGVGSFAEWIAKKLGAREVSISYAQRGDLVLVETDAGESLGIIDLSGHNALVTSMKGSRLLPLQFAKRAWRVG